MTDEKKTVIVTGASSGIGAATAERLARSGHRVILAARREDRMRGLVDTLLADGFRAEARVLDVVDRAATQVMVDEVAEEHGGIDVFVANAGLMLLSPVESMLVDEWERMVDVNLKGLLHGVGAVLPHFLAQGTGHFVTVASIGAHSVVPTSAVYSATKYAAWAFTEGLRQELDPAIRVHDRVARSRRVRTGDAHHRHRHPGCDADLSEPRHPGRRRRAGDLLRHRPAA